MTVRRLLPLLLLLFPLTLSTSACGGGGSEPGLEVTTPSGLVWQTLKEGKGTATVEKGDYITCHYTLWLQNGTLVASSKKENGGDGQTNTWKIGVGGLIAAWDEGVIGMKAGEVRKLIAPPQLAYGAAGRPPSIPPNATLVFEMELLSFRK